MKYYGLIIPRSYNDYFSRSDPAAIQQQMRLLCDSALDKTSQNPIQNKPIAELIPAQASDVNQLADKQFVNSSVGTNTANYISDNGDPFASVSALEAYAGTVTNNDYAFVTGTDSAGNTYYDRYKATVSGSSVTWAKEYRLNNSSFTAEQWDAVNSGITAAAVARIPAGYVPSIDDTQTAADKTWSSNKISTFASAGVICNTAAATQAKEVALVGFTLTTGACIRVMFTNENSATNPQLVINNGTAVYIKALKDGVKIAPPVHNAKWRGAQTASDETWQPNTILELMYDGTDFVIIGDPVVESYSSSTQSYLIYSTGLIKQSGLTTLSTSIEAQNLLIAYKDTNYVITAIPSNSSNNDPSTGDTFCIRSKAAGSFSCRWNNHGGRNWIFNWVTIGY